MEESMVAWLLAETGTEWKKYSEIYWKETTHGLACSADLVSVNSDEHTILSIHGTEQKLEIVCISMPFDSDSYQYFSALIKK